MSGSRLTPTSIGLCLVLSVSVLGSDAQPAEGPLSWQQLPSPWGDEPIRGMAFDTKGSLLVSTQSLYRLDGSEFVRDPGFAIPPSGRNVAVVPPGSDEVWVGSLSRISHFRSGVWDHFPVRDVEISDLSFSSPEDGWAGGGFGYLYHWDGSSWHLVEDPALPRGVGFAIQGIVAQSPDDVWVKAGRAGLIHYDGSGYRAFPPLGQKHVWSFRIGRKACRAKDGRILFAGIPVLFGNANGASQFKGLPGVNCCGIDGSGRVWLGGFSGELYRLEGSDPLALPSPVIDAIEAILFDQTGRGYLATVHRIYRTIPPGIPVFRDRGASAGVADAGNGTEARFFHLDRDLYPDLLLINAPGEARLFRNSGDWWFTDVTASSGLAGRR